MNYSWTGHARVTDLKWLSFALIFVGALFSAHFLLRLQHSRADQLLLSAAAFLAALGLISLYVWETRDANAYISTVALPAMREYRASVAEDPSLSSEEREDILIRLGPVPNELQYGSRQGRYATVLDAGWLESYNAAVRRLKVSLESDRREESALPAHEVELYDALRKQLLVADLSILLVPALLFAASRVGFSTLLASRLPLLGVSVLLLLIVGAAFLNSNGGEMPVSLRIGGQGVAVYEVLKIGLAVLLAMSLGQSPRSSTRLEVA